ncbi:Non-heme chloroperoxidase [Skermanella stibiiresistens SB22]|uniref:Non-heme chloroperoxidase n=2 Tax=Skermanella TaxID=204447 RepID=W9GX63_9PROT|nr:Non-heme chloroperoxidase [Skermanella stibiiresistens SB22]
MGGAKAHYDCVAAFSETDFTDDLRAVSVPVLLMHGEDDQVVPIGTSARNAIELLPNGALKTYPGLSHGMFATRPDVINSDLLAFIKGELSV